MLTKTDQFAYALHKVELVTTVDEQSLPVTAVIRQPFECADSQWLCAASISGLFHRKADLQRPTAEESVRAAKKFVLQELAVFVAGGGQLYTANRKPVTDLRKVLPKNL